MLSRRKRTEEEKSDVEKENSSGEVDGEDYY